LVCCAAALVRGTQVGNYPDFVCSADAEALARCQAHFSQWCIMKAPLILGSNLPAVDATTLSGASRARFLFLYCGPCVVVHQTLRVVAVVVTGCSLDTFVAAGAAACAAAPCLRFPAFAHALDFWFI
jgi:hypothetical protein